MSDKKRVVVSVINKDTNAISSSIVLRVGDTMEIDIDNDNILPLVLRGNPVLHAISRRIAVVIDDIYVEVESGDGEPENAVFVGEIQWYEPREGH